MKTVPGMPRTGKENLLPQPRIPVVTLQPRTYRQLSKGIDVIVNAIRPTLGPLPRLTVLERLKRTDVPEFLDDGALIARRIIEISPRGNDVGAMLIRHALWQMHEEAGDGRVDAAREPADHVAAGTNLVAHGRDGLFGERGC